MGRKYWLDLFTGTTWEEFLEHGAKVSGFKGKQKEDRGTNFPRRLSPLLLNWHFEVCWHLRSQVQMLF